MELTERKLRILQAIISDYVKTAEPVGSRTISKKYDHTFKDIFQEIYDAEYKEKFEESLDMISYRGPDDRGVFYDDNVALGHRRLAVIDLSEEGHQPFVYGDYVLVFNGEIYNYVELREELKTHGYVFKTKTDTEVIAVAYSYWGAECVVHFNGMWAFSIYDKEKQQVFSSRDRFGVKPFYYYCSGESICFASEIKQILNYRDKAVNANIESVKDFLISEYCYNSDKTLFEDVFQLGAGENMYIDLKDFSVSKDQYYNLKNSSRKQSGKRAYTDFKNVLKKAVEFRLRADVSVGSCLSGGLDSSTIVCMAKQILKEKFENNFVTVSSCFGEAEKEFDEQEYIDEVIKTTKAIARKVFPDFKDFKENLDSIVWHMDEPFRSTSIYAQWKVFQEAKAEGVTVMLDGQGADELLAGYDDFYLPFWIYLLKRLKLFTFVKEVYEHKKRFGNRTTNELLYNVFLNMLVPECVKRIVRKKRVKKWNLPFDEDDTLEVINRNKKYFDVKKHKKYFLDSIEYGLSELLRFEDRNSMAFSIESRVPFLDVDFVENAFSIPFEMKIVDSERKKVLREAMKDILPSKIYLRQSKLGFAAPESIWMNKNYEFFRTEITNACEYLSKILDRQRVMKWYESLNGVVDANSMGYVWRIVCAGRWAKIFNIQNLKE